MPPRGRLRSKNGIALYGNLAASLSRTDPDPETVVAQRDHEEVSESRVPTYFLGRDAAPLETQPYFSQPH
jgi:hypothetical protein